MRAAACTASAAETCLQGRSINPETCCRVEASTPRPACRVEASTPRPACRVEASTQLRTTDRKTFTAYACQLRVRRGRDRPAPQCHDDRGDDSHDGDLTRP